MDREGVDLTVLFPTRGLFVLGLDSSEQIGADGLEPDFAAAIARAYNDWLNDFRQAAPDRLHAAAMVAPHHIPAAGCWSASRACAWRCWRATAPGLRG